MDICPKCNQPIKDGDFTIGWGGASVNGQTEAHVNCPAPETTTQTDPLTEAIERDNAEQDLAPIPPMGSEAAELSHNPYMHMVARASR